MRHYNFGYLPPQVNNLKKKKNGTYGINERIGLSNVNDGRDV